VEEEEGDEFIVIGGDTSGEEYGISGVGMGVVIIVVVTAVGPKGLVVMVKRETGSDSGASVAGAAERRFLSASWSFRI